MKTSNFHNENSTLKEKIAIKSGIPSEVILGVPVVTIVGCKEFVITNYRGILEYTDSIVRVQTKTGQIKITGKNLDMNYYTSDEMKISGRIVKIEYI